MFLTFQSDADADAVDRLSTVVVVISLTSSIAKLVGSIDCLFSFSGLAEVCFFSSSSVEGKYGLIALLLLFAADAIDPRSINADGWFRYCSVY